MLLAFGLNQGRGMEKPETGSVVLENVKPSDLPEAWRKRLKAGAEERLTVTIATRPLRARASRPRASKRPNASFGMWADRVHIDPAAYVRALRRPRHAR
jgi:glycine/D-amino acid oxidase-like deaminating enzyme